MHPEALDCQTAEDRCRDESDRQGAFETEIEQCSVRIVSSKPQSRSPPTHPYDEEEDRSRDVLAPSRLHYRKQLFELRGACDADGLIHHGFGRGHYDTGSTHPIECDHVVCDIP